MCMNSKLNENSRTVAWDDSTKNVLFDPETIWTPDKGLTPHVKRVVVFDAYFAKEEY